jgi:hypothetical protein
MISGQEPDRPNAAEDGKRFIVRSAPRLAASLAIHATGVALPPTVRDASAPSN